MQPRDARRTGEPLSLGVRQLNGLIREMLETRVPPLWVEGEITGWKRYSSGHCYFCLRDADAQISAVMFASEARRLPMQPEEGMRVRAFGRVSLYEKRGDFQLIVRLIEETGAGGLWKIAFDRLRQKLDAEGMLAPERKRLLPKYPRTVGIVTSPVGAALHDILHVIRRRAPWTRIILSPARVQGEGAAQDIARAIGLFTDVDVDVVIVGRGGGSMEDLWAFNEEPVARAIIACRAPVISAVGHEVDITIADLVADLRAPTPSAAAEHAVPDGDVIRQEMAAAQHRLARALRRYAGVQRDQIELARERLDDRIHRVLEDRRGRVDWAQERLHQRMRRLVEARRATIGRLAGQLSALSPLESMARGFAVPLDAGGRILRRRTEFVPGAPFRLRVADGVVDCRVRNSEELIE